MSWYREKRILITGGSSGIGKATSAALARAGAHVVIAARGRERLADTCAELRPMARDSRQIVEAVAFDVSEPAQVARGVGRAIERLGGIDVLINNAGVACAARFEDTPAAEFGRMMATNYFGVVNVTRAALPHLKAQRSGNIANVSSVAGFLAIFGYTAYAPSKFAITGFSQALRQELRPHGIAVSVLFPPDTETPQLDEENRTKPLETRAIAGAGRPMSPEAVASALLAGVARGKFRIVPGLDAKLTEILSRHFPALVRWMTDRAVGKAPPGPI